MQNTTRQQDSKWRVSNSLFWYYIKQIMNVFIRAMERIFSFGERWNVPFNSAVASLNGTFHLSPHENILTIALINIHYLYTIEFPTSFQTIYSINYGQYDHPFLFKRGSRSNCENLNLPALVLTNFYKIRSCNYHSL